MGWLEALILGIIQGLTEFLPVSSSGHLEIGKQLLGVEATDDLLFTVVVHGATVLSTLVVFRHEILKLLKGLFRFEMNAETVYVFKLLLSMVPILIMGVFFKEQVEALFGNGLLWWAACFCLPPCCLPWRTIWAAANAIFLFGMPW